MLFDFIVDAGDERVRQRNTERPRRIRIDRQTEQVGLVDWQITGLGALENLVDEDSEALSQLR